MNQLELTSDVSETTFAVPSNGGYLMKLILTLDRRISYHMLNQLNCALIKQFQLTSSRIYNQLQTFCGRASLFTEGFSAEKYVAPHAVAPSRYLYHFYVIPDYNLSTDNTNYDIQVAISDRSFNASLMSKVIYAAGTDALALLDVNTEDLDAELVPTVNVASATLLNGTMELFIQMIDYNGFAFLGLV